MSPPLSMTKWLYGYSKQGHSIFYAMYRVVLATKYRRRLLRGGIEEYLKINLQIIGRHYPEIRIFEAAIDEDHLQMLVSVPPKIAISHVVNIIKTNTARALREKFKFLKQLCDGGGGIWSGGYFVSTVEINEEIIKKYIEYQGDEDRGQSRLEF